MSDRQLELFTYISEFIMSKGKAPSFKEMRAKMEVSSNQTIEDWLVILEREDYIFREGSVRKQIHLTNKGKESQFPSLAPNLASGPLKSQVSVLTQPIVASGVFSTSQNFESYNGLSLRKDNYNGTS